jgi:hypothetical protein
LTARNGNNHDKTVTHKAIDRAEGLLSVLAVFVMLATPALSVELFRCGGAALDGGTLEYVFEAGEQNSPNAVTKEKAAEIAADFMATGIADAMDLTRS